MQTEPSDKEGRNMTYWGWLLVGIALLLTALSGTQTSLCQRMRSVPVYRGLTYWEVQQIAKAAPTSFTPCGEDTIRRWVSGRSKSPCASTDTTSVWAWRKKSTDR